MFVVGDRSTATAAEQSGSRKNEDRTQSGTHGATRDGAGLMLVKQGLAACRRHLRRGLFFLLSFILDAPKAVI